MSNGNRPPLFGSVLVTLLILLLIWILGNDAYTRGYRAGLQKATEIMNK